MAPPRMGTFAARASGSGGINLDAPRSGLFFGGTQLLKKTADDEDEDEEQEEQDQDQADYYESDADEDDEEDEYDETSVGARRRKATSPTPKRRVKAPLIKPIDSEPDEEDQLIIELKRAGYKDDAVARRLVTEGHAEYSSKRIASRWTRLKKHIERKEEERLDDELSDWHIGQDEKLRECFNAADAKYEVELLKLKERKWKEVSASMAEALREKKYTPKACKERWESLEDGTALIAIELDPDQEGRFALRQARIAENKRRRDEQKAAVIWASGAKERKAAERQAMLQQREDKKNEERARKQAEIDEENRIKEERRAALEKKRGEQRAIEAEGKAYHERKREERKNADAMYQYYTGKKLNGRRDKNLIKSRNGESDDSDVDSDFTTSDEEPDLTDAEEDAEDVSDNGTTTTGGKRKKSSKSKDAKEPKAKKPKVTLETLVNPRTIMSNSELNDVLARRELSARGPNETHPELVARIAAADATESQARLKELLGAYFDRRKGSKEVLARRLQEHDAAESQRGQQGIVATDPEFKKDYEGYRGNFSYALED